MTKARNLYSGAARKMAKAIGDSEGRDDLLFREDGSRIMPAGRPMKRLGIATGLAVFIVRYPFRPGLASCEDMVAERQARLDEGSEEVVVVAYDQQRWDEDPRVDEAAGIGDVTEIEEMLIEAAWELAA